MAIEEQNDAIHEALSVATSAPTVDAEGYNESELTWPSLLGRDAEHQQLVDSVAQVMGTGTPQVIIVKGESGVGKSTTIRMALDHAITTFGSDAIVYGEGKYEQLEESRPFSAIVDATADLYEKLSSETQMNLQRSFTRQEMFHLCAVLPSLSRLLVGSSHDQVEKEFEKASDEHGFTTFLRLYRKLLGVICTDVKCLVLFLDDVQWSDDVSRCLVEGIVLDSKLSNLLLLFSQRTGPKEEDYKVAPEFQPISMEMRCFESEKVNELVSSALRMDPNETIELGEMVYRRCLGNPYYVMQFVVYLFSRKMIRNVDSRYEWDIQDITSRTKSANNVVELLSKKLKAVPSEIRIALVIASHLGFKFKAAVLTDILENTEIINLFTSRHPMSLTRYMNTLYSGLEQATSIGLIERIANDEFRFVHDRVQQAAREMLPKGSSGEKILQKVGEMLLRHLNSGASEPWIIYSVTKLLTKYPSPVIPQSKVAELCLQASSLARKQSAYRSSVKYAESGIKQLGKAGWKTHYQLCLNLHCMAVEMCHAAAQPEKCKILVEKIEKNAIKLEDTFRAQRVLLETLNSEGKWTTCIDKCQHYLKGVGVRFPRKASQLNVVSHLLKAKMLLRGRDASRLVSLPTTTNAKQLHAAYLLTVVSETAFTNGNDDICACACLKMLHLVLKQGVSDNGVFAFVSYAVCLTHLGLFSEAATFFDVTKSLSAGRPEVLIRVTPALHLMGHFLSHHVLESPESLRRDYESALALGDIYRASLSLRVAMAFEFYVGVSLPQLEEKAAFCQGFFKDYGQTQSFKLTAPTMQMIECLQGRATDPSILSGSFVESESIFQLWNSGKCQDAGHRILVVEAHYCQNLLWLVHDNLELFLEDRKKYGGINEEMGSYYRKLLNCFHCALAHFSLSATSKCKNRKAARRYVHEIRRHAVMGSPMLTTMLVLIEAEEAALDGKTPTAFKLYEQAASDFESQSLFLHNAIALERAGKHGLSVGDSRGAQFMRAAYSSYERHGARSKIQLLQERYPSLHLEPEVPMIVISPQA